MKILAGIDFAHSDLVSPTNPYGWRHKYGGDFPSLAADWPQIQALGVDGLLVRFADGAEDHRPIGFRSDGVQVTTCARSLDMLDDETFRARIPAVRGLATTSTLFYDTGIPEPGRSGSDAAYQLVADRLDEMRVEDVVLDASGRNLHQDVGRFVRLLRHRGKRVHFEPLAVAQIPPAWAEGRPVVAMDGVLDFAVRRGVAIPPGSFAWHNGRHPPEPGERDKWAGLGLAGMVVAVEILKGQQQEL